MNSGKINTTNSWITIAGIWILLAGCAGSAPQGVTWKRSMSEVFDNSSVRPGEPPRRLWTRRDEDRLLRQLGYADAVALGTIRLVNKTSMRGRRQLALAFKPTEVFHGAISRDLDSDGVLRLRLGPSSRDYHRAARVEHQLPGTRYLLFVKRKPGRRGKVRLRWAFYQPRRQLLAEVRARFRWLRQDRQQGRDKQLRERRARQLAQDDVDQLLAAENSVDAPTVRTRGDSSQRSSGRAR